MFIGSGSCPECNIPLRRINFRVQLFEDASVEKEVDIRKRILRDFNKKEDDFETLRQYNDYLEEIENIIFNLVNDIDVEETTKKIEQYKRENKEQIIKNKTRLGKRDHEIEEMLEMEKQQEMERRKELARQELEVKKRKILEKEALIDELMFSDQDARNILDNFSCTIQANREEEKVSIVPKATHFSTGIQFGSSHDQQTFATIPKFEEGPMYTYVPIKQDFEGPEPPTAEKIGSRGYLAHVREPLPAAKSGGFVSIITCLRALQEAMSGLYHFPNRHEIEPLTI